jgi:hypothetical protein
LVNVRPTEVIARFRDNDISVEWDIIITKNPIAPTAVPTIIGLIDPNFDISRHDTGPNTRNTRANGSCTFAALIGSPPNPTGFGFSTNIGIV